MKLRGLSVNFDKDARFTITATCDGADQLRLLSLLVEHCVTIAKAIEKANWTKDGAAGTPVDEPMSLRAVGDDNSS